MEKKRTRKEKRVFSSSSPEQLVEVPFFSKSGLKLGSWADAARAKLITAKTVDLENMTTF